MLWREFGDVFLSPRSCCSHTMYISECRFETGAHLCTNRFSQNLLSHFGWMVFCNPFIHVTPWLTEPYSWSSGNLNENDENALGHVKINILTSIYAWPVWKSIGFCTKPKRICVWNLVMICDAWSCIRADTHKQTVELTYLPRCQVKRVKYSGKISPTNNLIYPYHLMLSYRPVRRFHVTITYNVTESCRRTTVSGVNLIFSKQAILGPVLPYS